MFYYFCGGGVLLKRPVWHCQKLDFSLQVPFDTVKKLISVCKCRLTLSKAWFQSASAIWHCQKADFSLQSTFWHCQKHVFSLQEPFDTVKSKISVCKNHLTLSKARFQAARAVWHCQKQDFSLQEPFDTVKSKISSCKNRLTLSKTNFRRKATVRKFRTVVWDNK